jgi:phosphatidylglycerol---prolipoprotein diacylglyceryl transferase
MFPVIFKIGNFELHTYGVMFALAFAAAVYLTVRRGKKYGYEFSQMYDLSMVVIFSSLIGARLTYVIFHLDEFKGRYWDIINPFQSTGQIGLSGMVLLGGVITAAAAVLIYIRIKKYRLGEIADIIAPSLVVGIAIGRLGCFMNGCCFGEPCNLPWAVKFPPGSYAFYVYGDVHVHPTQLYEVLYATVIFIILSIIEKKKPFHGFNFALFLVLYGIGRFFNETLRYYNGSEAGMKLQIVSGLDITFSQITSLVMLLTGLIIILTRKRSQDVGTRP